MTILVCEQLETNLTQTVNLVFNKVYHLDGIKIKLLMYNAPAGNFTLSVKSGAETLASSSFTSADMKSDLSTADNYAHLYKALDISLILKKGSYDFVLSSSGYTFSESSFIGWCKSYENVFNEEVDALLRYTDKPFDFLIYENIREDLTR